MKKKHNKDPQNNRTNTCLIPYLKLNLKPLILLDENEVLLAFYSSSCFLCALWCLPQWNWAIQRRVILGIAFLPSLKFSRRQMVGDRWVSGLGATIWKQFLRNLVKPYLPFRVIENFSRLENLLLSGKNHHNVTESRPKFYISPFCEKFKMFRW